MVSIKINNQIKTNDDGSKETINLINVFNNLGNAWPVNFIAFIRFYKIVKAFEAAELTGTLELDDALYQYLLETFNEHYDIFSTSPEMLNVYNDFVNATQN